MLNIKITITTAKKTANQQSSHIWLDLSRNVFFLFFLLIINLRSIY